MKYDIKKLNQISFTRKLLYLLSLSGRKNIFLIFILLIFATFLEVLGVGLIIPVFTLIIDVYTSESSSISKIILNFLGNPSLQELIVITSLLLVLFYLFKIFFLMFVEWVQYKFIYLFQADLSKKLLELYLHRPYLFHKKNNSSRLIRNVLSEISLFSSIILNTAILLIEVLIIIGISTLLIYFQPFSFAFVSVSLLFLGGLFYLLAKNKIFNWGKNRQLHEGLRMQHLQQSLGAFKMIKLSNSQNFFLSKFNFHNYNIAEVNLYQSFIRSIPRLSLEFLAILAFSILITSLILQNTPIDEVIPILALYAAACFRLLPSVNRVLSSLQILRFAEPSVNLLYDEFIEKNVSPIKEGNIEFNNKIKFKNVSFRYDDSDKFIINKINLEIPYGSIVGFVGESGSGKSTIIDLLTGLLNPTAGQIFVDEKNISSNIEDWRGILSYIPQDIYFTDDTVAANIAFGIEKEKVNVDKIYQTLSSVALSEVIEKLPLKIHTIIGEGGLKLSGGQRQRIGIARALYTGPKILILDESTSALDNDTEDSIINEILKLKGKTTVIIVSHRLNTIKNCDFIFEISSNGEIEKKQIK